MVKYLVFVAVTDTTRKNTWKYRLQSKAERKDFTRRKQTKENQLQ